MSGVHCTLVSVEAPCVEPTATKVWRYLRLIHSSPRFWLNRFVEAETTRTVSSRRSVLIPGAPSEIGVFYADGCARRASGALLGAREGVAATGEGRRP